MLFCFLEFSINGVNFYAFYVAYFPIFHKALSILEIVKSESKFNAINKPPFFHAMISEEMALRVD
jgi:hypothetical protein